MDSSFLLKLGFIVLPSLLVALASCLAHSAKFAIVCVGIMFVSSALAASGWLSNFEALPPRMFILLLPLVIFAVGAAMTSTGTKFAQLSFAWLVGFQAFRLPLELLIYQAVAEQVAPPQFTWTGLNFDVVLGLSAILLFPFGDQSPKWVLWCWNLMGIGLLLNVVAVAIVSVPGPLQMMTPDNRWIAHFPFVWLPCICVMAALFGHIVMTRKLLHGSGQDARIQS